MEANITRAEEVVHRSMELVAACRAAREREEQRRRERQRRIELMQVPKYLPKGGLQLTLQLQ